MDTVTLIFQDTYEISDFLIENKITQVEVNSGMLSLTASLTADEIMNAYLQHHACLLKNVLFIDEDCD